MFIVSFHFPFHRSIFHTRSKLPCVLQFELSSFWVPFIPKLHLCSSSSSHTSALTIFVNYLMCTLKIYHIWLQVNEQANKHTHMYLELLSHCRGHRSKSCLVSWCHSQKTGLPCPPSWGCMQCSRASVGLAQAHPSKGGNSAKLHTSSITSL